MRTDTDAAIMAGVQFVFDPVKKTALVIRDDVVIGVPGRFENQQKAHAACLQVVRARYFSAYVREDEPSP